MRLIQFQLALIAVQISLLGIILRKIYERMPTPKPKQAVATQAANRSVGEKAGEVGGAGSEGNSRA